MTLQMWTAALRRAATGWRDQPERHADALDAATYDFLLTDTESVQRTHRLLMWQDRDTPPVRGL